MSVCVRLRVVGGEVYSGATMFVVGSCEELGQWRPQHALTMQQRFVSDDFQQQDQVTWEVKVPLPKEAEVEYRFFVGRVVGEAGQPLTGGRNIEVLAWETNIHPRHLHTTDAEEMEVPTADFGSYGGVSTVSKGWLTNQECIQIRFHNNPIFMWKPKYRNQLYSIKCSAVDFEPGLVDARTVEPDLLVNEDSPSLDGPQVCDRTAVVYYNLNQGQLQACQQPQHGCLYNTDDYLVFVARGFNRSHLGFQLDFFVHKKDAQPRFVGSSHLLPRKMNISTFNRRTPIIGLHHRLIGEVQVETLHITPLGSQSWTMAVSYQNHWKRWKGEATLNVGHRGMGSSYKSVTNVKENTIRSLYSAAQHGADYVELDVLLTKDQVPVIYHDFSVCLATSHRSRVDKHLLEIAVKDLSLHQLQSLKMYHSSSNPQSSIEITEHETDDNRDHHPFPTLQACLEQVDPSVGFNIEIKYPQLVETGVSEQDNYFDLNPYIDGILDVVLQHAGHRKVIFSSFHADSCIMASLKQNKYPVLFLSNGPTQRYTPYSDWRCTNFLNGMNFAKAEGLMGVSFQAEGLLQDLSVVGQVHGLGLVLFVWGEDLNDDNARNTLRRMQVDAIIFDRIGQPHPDSFMVAATPTPSLEDLMRRKSQPQQEPDTLTLFLPHHLPPPSSAAQQPSSSDHSTQV